MRLQGKNAVVTGAGLSGSIGWGIARVLAREGANVAVVDIDEKSAVDTANGLGESGVQAFALKVDVADYAAVVKAIVSNHHHMRGPRIMAGYVT